MGNLIRMDLYRMRKAKGFKICLLLAFVVALLSTPAYRLLMSLSELLGAEVDLFPKQKAFSEILSKQPGSLGTMLCLLSICGFFYADVENGYVKNIAGQMPKQHRREERLTALLRTGDTRQVTTWETGFPEHPYQKFLRRNLCV